jgi:hypothetical protein
VSFRNPELTGKFGAHGLKDLEPQFRAEYQVYREQAEREMKLRKTLLESLGLNLDKPEAISAIHEFNKQHPKPKKQSSELDSSAALGRHAVSRSVNPAIIRVPPNQFGSVSYPPFDGTWTTGTYAEADKANAYDFVKVNSSNSRGGSPSDSAGAGVLLWVVPPSPDPFPLLMIPNISVGYAWEMDSSGGWAWATSNGFQNVLIKGHDGNGNVIPGSIQDSRNQIWTATEQSVFGGSNNDRNSYTTIPAYLLSGAAYYEVWFWITAGTNSGFSDFGGYSECIAWISLNVNNVFIMNPNAGLPG